MTAGALTVGPLQARASTPPACADLAGVAPGDVKITAASPMAAGAEWSAPPDLPHFRNTADFCRIQGTIESEIGFELWLPPPAAWNGKLLGAGVGGDAGRFNYRDLARGVARGYAAATTDTGHKAADANWMLGQPQRLKNFELRANHLLADASKAIIARYYARRPRHSYFIGCSGGGRQGLKEMQRHPTDYDGIIAGAPGPDTAEMTARRMWEILQRDAHPGLMSREDWLFLAREGVRACDAEDPRQCTFRPHDLACRGAAQSGGDAGSRCLSADQVRFAETLYAPLKDENGKQLDEGLLPGVVVDSGRSRLAPATFGQAVRGLPDWNGQDFRLADDLPAIDRVMPELRADDPRLDDFRAHGGKAILYQGWLDPAVAARMTLHYYERVEAAMGGPAKSGRFIRLFMVPGMLHCAGGDVPDQFGGSGSDAPIVDAEHDLLSALDRWVEKGDAPDRVIASMLVAGQVTQTRLLCASPQHAHYRGSGAREDAGNFVCRSD